ncbi:pilus assembly protein [Lysobacter enzymogenes]|uniref:pilus assembly protein n=1 Tax=Lysobacter enzymogenes TaxID=69 RepID=UPI003851609B
MHIQPLQPRLRRFSLMLAGVAAAAAALALLPWLRGDGVAGSRDYELATQPLYVGGNAPPLLMLVASRDEQLFDKAYADYTDLDGDGVVDSTYNNGFDYEGYFDPFLCYAYNAGVFSAAGGRNADHKCSGNWSGNFLNWVTMSRVDMLRYVLYGGNRSVDVAGQTVLERAHLPNDTHSWAKIYTGSDIASYVGSGVAVSNNTATFCNVSLGANEPPLMRVAGGSFVNWAETEVNQCLNKGALGKDDEGDPDRPDASTDFIVKVQVCNGSGERESFCSQYGTGYKPTGLLQQFGENGKLRFGLVSGSYSKPRAGGVLRKNIGLFAGNGSNPAVCAEGDEVRLSDGTFCNQDNNQQGVINALRRFRLVGWTGGDTNSWRGPGKGVAWGDDCRGWGVMNRTSVGNGTLNDPGGGDWKCTPWGNPVAEMYAEALRYIAGETTPSTAFSGDTANDIQSGQPAWVDPYGKKDGVYGGNAYCASCSVLILSSGSPSYDGEVPAVARLGTTAEASTKALGDAEDITGKSFFVGSAAGTSASDLADSSNFVCLSTRIGDLSYVRGICDDSPQREGSYLVAGLARAAYAADLRSNNIENKPPSAKVNVTTFAVELADTMPKLDIRTGAGTVSLTPYCKADPIGTPDEKKRRTCQLGDTLAGKQVATVGKRYVYGRDISANGGSYMFSWDGSPLGESNDRDFGYMLTYCVGSACYDDTNPANNGTYRGYDICWAAADSPDCGGDGRPSVGPNDVLVRTEMISASSSNALMVGFSAIGTTNDGLYQQVLRKRSPGLTGKVYNLLNGATSDDDKYPMLEPTVADDMWAHPKVVKLTPAGRATSSLQSPLWYAAKYGTSTGDLDLDGRPDWDEDGDGQPDNYLKARNPAKLKSELARLIGKAAGIAPVTGGAASGVRLTAGSSVSLVSSFKLSAGKNDWNGDLVAYDLNPDGSLGAKRWSAADVLNTQTVAKNRSFRLFINPTTINVDTGARVGKGYDIRGTLAEVMAQRSGDGVPRNVRDLFGLGDTDKAWLGNVSDDTLIDYMSGAYNGPPFRKRPSLLGDIVNSSVEVLTSKDDYGYGAWANHADKDQKGKEWKTTLAAAYETHLQRKRKAADAFDAALVGSNDGMVHVFSLATGSERVAFISSSAREKMGQVANPSYRHQFIADGEISSGDIYAGSRFYTFAVAAMGGGSKSVIAMPEGSTSELYGLWDMNWELRGTEGTHKLLDDLGYVFGRPLLVPITGETPGGAPRWVALFGNGVNSYTGDPVLYVVDAAYGGILARLKPSDTGYRGKNGLFNIAPVALYNNDGVVDTVYGGDLQGNVWKFDLSSVSPAQWKVAFAGKPLFTATDGNGKAQPITGGLEVARAPGGGTFVSFGTGRYFAVGDNIVPADPQVQSFYGIYDRCAAADCTTPIADGRKQLARQTVTEGKTSDGYLTRNISDNPPGRNGWYLDLRVGDSAGTGERFIGVPRLQNGKVVFIAYQPLGNDCQAGGRNWRYAVDLLSGGGAMGGVSARPGGTSICTGNCGAVSSAEETVSPPQTKLNVLTPPPPSGQLIGCGTDDPACAKPESLSAALAQQRCSMVLSVPGAAGLYLPRPCGRQSWRQVR